MVGCKDCERYKKIIEDQKVVLVHQRSRVSMYQEKWMYSDGILRLMIENMNPKETNSSAHREQDPIDSDLSNPSPSGPSEKKD